MKNLKSKSKKATPQNESYKCTAKKAIKYEQAREYALAAKQWHVAMTFARGVTNKNWAKYRFAFCVRAAERKSYLLDCHI